MIALSSVLGLGTGLPLPRFANPYSVFQAFRKPRHQIATATKNDTMGLTDTLINQRTQRPMKMPDNPNNWLTLIMSMPGEIQALVAAIITATLRVVYDKSETSWQRIGLEGALCGCIAVGLYSGAGYLGLPPSAGVFIGSNIGFVGVLKFREFAFRFIGNKVDK